VTLEVALAKYDARTGVQIAVVTVKSLGGYSIEEYAKRLSNSWGVGKKGVDNGVMFLVAPTERKIRIAVGDGLAAQLSDHAAKRIIENEIAPRFRKNRLNEGLSVGARSIMQALDSARASPEVESGAIERKSSDFGEVATFHRGGFLCLVVVRMFIRASIARHEREDNKRSTLSLLDELPKKLNEARLALGHADVSKHTRDVLDTAIAEFEKEKTAARMAPELPHSARSLRHVDSTVNVALENAEHEKALAKKARAEGPKLLKSFRKLSQKPRGGGRRQVETGAGRTGAGEIQRGLRATQKATASTGSSCTRSS